MIDVAAHILSDLGRPATAKDIIEHARQHPRLSSAFGGQTPHKTLNARIATEMVALGDSSRFFRFAPSVYGLRSMLDNGSYEPGYRKVYLAKRRSKEVCKEEVADFFRVDGLYDGARYPLSILDMLEVQYLERKHAEERGDLKQLVSYSYIKHDDVVLAFEKGTYTSDKGEFIGRQSIGFGGHINHGDVSLFDGSPAGFYSSVDRELHEELYIFRKELRGLVADVSFEGFLVDSTTENGRKHLGMVAKINLKERIALETKTLGIRNLRWITTKVTPNCFNNFEIWSQYLFRYLQMGALSS